jgi:hypothetical protein
MGKAGKAVGVGARRPAINGGGGRLGAAVTGRGRGGDGGG